MVLHLWPMGWNDTRRAYGSVNVWKVSGMTDRERIIERLSKVSYYFKSLLAVGQQSDADIYREHMESVNMAIAMLKEQELVKSEHSVPNAKVYYQILQELSRIRGEDQVECD